MDKIAMKNDALLVEGKPLFIYSGEMHYFRVKKSDWLDRIKKAKKANLNTLSSYISWRWHSLDENTYDFNGKTFPSRDLVSFLELLKKEKMYFIARIGPITHGEIIDDGLPEWLPKNYPEIRLKNYAGQTNPYSPMVDYHNPTFHRCIKDWYSRVVPIIQKYLISNGGPIILIQLDNEISMPTWLAKAPCYSDYSNSLFRNYLKDKYKNIGSLNQAFKTKYQSFDEIQQPEGTFAAEKGAFLLEWEEYYREFYALYYKKLYDYLTDYKIDLPVIANIPQIYDYDVKGRGNMGIMTTCMFKTFGKHVPNIIFGGAYQYRRLDYENFTDITAMSEIVRMISPEGHPVVCAEMQTGVLFDRPVIYPSDVELDIKTSIGTGLNGINMYMFAGGENYFNMGLFCTHHAWQAAVDDQGKLARHYKSVQDVGEFVKNNNALLIGTRNLHEINIGLYTPYYQTEYIKGDFSGSIMWRRDSMLFDGLLRLLSLAGFNYRFVDLKDTPKEKLLGLDNLWIFSLEFMDRPTQEKIAELVKAGKKLLFYPTVPDVDLNNDTCDVLKSALQISKITTLPGTNRVKKDKGDAEKFYAGNEVRYFEVNDPASIKPLVFTEGDKTSAFLMPSKNILVSGFDLNHRFDNQLDFVKDFARQLDITCEVVNPNMRVNVMLRHSDKVDILFVANFTEMEEKTKVNLSRRPYPVDLPITAPGRKSNIFFTNYQILPDLKLNFVTGEIMKTSKNKNELTLTVKSDLPEVDVCYQGKYKLKSSGKVKVVKQSPKYTMVKVTPDNGRFELTFKK